MPEGPLAFSQSLLRPLELRDVHRREDAAGVLPVGIEDGRVGNEEVAVERGFIELDRRGVLSAKPFIMRADRLQCLTVDHVVAEPAFACVPSESVALRHGPVDSKERLVAADDCHQVRQSVEGTLPFSFGHLESRHGTLELQACAQDQRQEDDHANGGSQSNSKVEPVSAEHLKRENLAVLLRGGRRLDRPERLPDG